MAETLNLYQKLAKISGEIEKVEKTGKNTFQNYAFIEQAMVVAILRGKLAEHNIVIRPAVLSREIFTKEGGKGIKMILEMRFTVVNGDDPEEQFYDFWLGEADDTSDKATNKAMTAAEKTYLMKLFKISDKDDPDAHQPEAAPMKATPKLEKPAEYNHDLEKLKIQARTLMTEHGYVKEKAGEFLQTVISKDKPVTKQDYTDIIEALND